MLRAILREWRELSRETFAAVRREDVENLYSREWAGARAKLVAAHRDDIASIRGRFRRSFFEVHAILIGLARKLAPARRLILGAALICFVLPAFGPFEFSHAGKHTTIRFELAGFFLVLGFILLLVLVAMELVDKIEFRDELVLARELQASLIPSNLPSFSGYELAAYNRIANMVGGDLYDFVALADGSLSVLFGDASGHGMTAGLIMAVAHAGFRTQLEVDPSPSAVATTLNRILRRTGSSRTFFAGVAMRLSAAGEITAIVAGHPAPLIVRPDGSVRAAIGVGAYPLGIKDGVTWPKLSDSLAPGESLVLFSDGVTEARNAAGEEYGDERLAAAVRRTAGLPAASVTAAIASDVLSHCGRLVPEDDVSVAVIRRLP